MTCEDFLALAYKYVSPSELRYMSFADWMLMKKQHQEEMNTIAMNTIYLRNDIRQLMGADPIPIEDGHVKEAPRMTSRQKDELRDSWADWYDTDATC